MKCERVKNTSMATGGNSKGWRRGGTPCWYDLCWPHDEKKKSSAGYTKNGSRVKVWRRQVQAQRGKAGTAKEAGRTVVKAAEKVPTTKNPIVLREKLGIAAYTGREEKQSPRRMQTT